MLNLFRSKPQISTQVHPTGDAESRRREKRRKLKSDMPHVRLEEKHTAGSAVLPSRQVMLSKIPAGGVVCEVGVSRGEFSADIMSLNRPRKLHLVDVWESERYAPHLEEVLQRFKVEIGAGAVEINRGMSTDVLPTY